MPFPPSPSGFPPKINGVAGAYLQPIRYGRDQSGNYELYQFKGTQAEIFDLAIGYSKTIGIVYEVSQLPGNLWQLDVRFPWNADGFVSPETDFVEQWELFNQSHEKDIIASGTGPAGLITPEEGGFIRTKINTQQYVQTDNNDAAWTEADFTALLDATVDPNGTTDSKHAAWITFSKYLRGETSVQMFVPFLRHSVVTSLQYAVPASLANIGRIFTSGYMLGNYDISQTALLFGLPNDSIPAGDKNPELQYGWLKFYPTVQEVALQKWQIVQEWEYGRWDTDLYGAVDPT